MSARPSLLSGLGSLWLGLLWFGAAVAGIELGEFYPGHHGHGNRKRDVSGLDLKSSETFLWHDGTGRNTDEALASLTVHMPGEHEHILSTEQFHGMFTSMTCGPDNIAIAFEDDATFAYAKSVWDWVNGADNHSFAMVVSAGHCDNDNDRRALYMVSTITYDEDANKAFLAANRTNWEAIAHTYDLVVGNIGDPLVAGDPIKEVKEKIDPEKVIEEGKKKANDILPDVKKAFSINFDHHFPPFSFNPALVTPESGLFGASISCTNCSTTGSFDGEFRLKVKLNEPNYARLRLRPKGVSVTAVVRLAGTIGLSPEEPFNQTLKDNMGKGISFEPYTITDGIWFAPYFELWPVFEILPTLIGLSLEGGGTAIFNDGAVLEFDVLNPGAESNQFSGWKPKWVAKPWRVSAQISTEFYWYLRTAVGFKAKIMSVGLDANVNLRAPTFNVKAAAIYCKCSSAIARRRRVGLFVFALRGRDHTNTMQHLKEPAQVQNGRTSSLVLRSVPV